MLRFGLYALALLLSAMVVAPAGATVIDYGAFPGGQVGGNPGWQGITTNGSLITTGAYWNNGSLDCTVSGCGNNNMGNYMAGNDGSSVPGQLEFDPSQVQWWGNASDLSADTNMAFNTASVGGFVGANLRVEVAGNAASNEFGYYLTGDPGTLFMLFDGAATTNASTVFLPVGDFGFYLKDTKSGKIYLTDSLVQSGDVSGAQHFTAFRDTTLFPRSIWLGMEDLPFGSPGSDKDFQDMIVRIDAVPEPATLLLVGSSLLVLGFAGVRARRRS